MDFFIKNYDKTKFVILLLLVATLPFYLKISNVLVGLAAFVTVLNCFFLRRWDILKVDRLSVALGCYFLLEIVGLLYTEKTNLKIGFYTLDKHQGMILVPLIFSDLKLQWEAREKLLTGFVVSCVVASLICIGVNMYESITVYDKIFHEWLFSHHRISEPIGMHAVYFAMYLGLCVIIVLERLKEKYQRFSTGKVFLLILLLIYLLVVIVALGARTATAGLIGIVFVNILYYGYKQRSTKLYILAALIPLLFSAIIWLNPVVKIRFMDMLKSSYEKSNYGSYFARTHIWVPGWEAIRENIFFGVGTGDHQTELDKKYLKHNYTEGVRLKFNMHNQYLQTALNHGLVGVVLLLAIFYVQLKKSFRNKDALYLSFLVLFMVVCITEAMLVKNKGTVYFLVFSFVFYRSGRNQTVL
jgi:O-antigen ligase